MRYRMAIFDLENTLSKSRIDGPAGEEISPSLWTVIPRILGPDAEREENETKARWLRGEYASGIAWAEDSLRVHKKYGLTRETFRSIIDATELLPGYDALLAKLRSAGIMTGIISGGFVAHAEHVRQALGIDWAVAACAYTWSPDGSLDSWDVQECDYEHKVARARHALDVHGISPRECVFVGDGSNDVPLAAYVGRSYAVNANPKLARVATRSLVGDDVAHQIARDLGL